MQNRINWPFYINVRGDILRNKGKIFVGKQVGNVVRAAGDEVIHANDIISLFEESLAEMRPNKTRTTSDQHTCHTRDLPLPVIAPPQGDQLGSTRTLPAA